MTAFDKAFNYTMEWEGGSKTTNDPDDPGGVTVARRKKYRIFMVEVSPWYGKKSGLFGRETRGMR